jgi:pimeloyl-ACP methyl ester carboxylesterase
MSTITTRTASARTAPTSATPLDETTPGARGHIGRTVTSTMLGGFLLAVAAVTGPFAGAEEHLITGSVLGAFAASWALLAFLSARWTDQPQRWAKVPAAAMAVAAAAMFVLAPTGNQLGWVWPPAILAMVSWMVVRSRRDLRSRTRVLVLYPVFGALALSAVGGAYETYREAGDPAAAAMPGRLVDVGGHRLHISCTGSGSPTVVLEAGLGEASMMMAAWIAPDVAPVTRVCVYDRAGRGWSESADQPQDGLQVATDLHTLLSRAGEPGPYLLAGHSAGGIYVLDFAKAFPDDVAGVVLLDSMHPEQYERMASWPGFYEMFRRASAVMPSLARLGVGRLVYGAQYGDLPSPQRDQERAFLATPRHNRSVRDEFHMLRTAMDQAAELPSLGDVPLAVVTARSGADADWFPMQDDLAALSTNSVHRFLDHATHAMVVEDEATAHQSSRAILDVVSSVRTGSPISASATTTAVERPSDLVDQLVSIDGGRMHLRCVGTGSTTVLLIAGWGGGGDSWGAVEPAVSERARVCSYARLGTGTSDPQTSTQTFDTQAADLHALLDEADEPGPYVVLGHSFGGAEAVTFASRYPDQVIGLMLLDASPTTWPATVCSVAAYDGLCAVMHDPTLDPERLDVFPAFDEVAAVASLGDLPMTVMTAAHRTDPTLAPSELTRLDAIWAEGVQRWAGLSSSSRTVTVEDTGHHIELDRPQLVVDALLTLLP